MKNIILVEGKDDVDFLNILTENINIQSFTFDKIDGSNQELLSKKLEAIKNDFQLNPFAKLGIILDLDNYSADDRLELINTCLSLIFGQKLSKINNFQKFQLFGLELDIACFFIEPNLDVIKRKISIINPEKADCLFKCIDDEGINKKERDKAWVYYYMLWDVCDKKEREKRGKHVNFSYTSSKSAWDLESEELKSLELFLMNF